MICPKDGGKAFFLTVKSRFSVFQIKYRSQFQRKIDSRRSKPFSGVQERKIGVIIIWRNPSNATIATPWAYEITEPATTFRNALRDTRKRKGNSRE